MPNFKIRRKRREVPPPQPPQPVKEEKVDDAEMSVSEESSDPGVSEAMSKLGFENPAKIEQPPRKVRKVGFQTPPQQQKPAIPAQQNQFPARNRQNYTSLYHTTDPYRRKPTMQYSNPHRRKPGGARKLRYNSHYGMGGENLDTRTKSTLLYHHCFG